MEGILQMDQLEAAKILGVKPDSPAEEVREAYRELTAKYHPEEYPEEFAQIQKAYRVLSRKHFSPVPVYQPVPAAAEETEPEGISDPFEEEQRSLFERLDEAASKNAYEQSIAWSEREYLRNIIVYRAQIDDTDRLYAVLQKYPLSYRQYTGLESRLSDEAARKVRQKDASYKKLVAYLKQKRGVKPLTKKALVIWGMVFFLMVLMEYLLKEDMVWYCAFSLGMSLWVYDVMRKVALRQPAGIVFWFMMVISSVTITIGDTEPSMYLGVSLMFLSLVMITVDSVWWIIAAVKNRKVSRQTSI